MTIEFEAIDRHHQITPPVRDIHVGHVVAHGRGTYAVVAAGPREYNRRALELVEVETGATLSLNLEPQQRFTIVGNFEPKCESAIDECNPGGLTAKGVDPYVEYAIRHNLADTLRAMLAEPEPKLTEAQRTRIGRALERLALEPPTPADVQPWLETLAADYMARTLAHCSSHRMAPVNTYAIGLWAKVRGMAYAVEVEGGEVCVRFSDGTDLWFTKTNIQSDDTILFCQGADAHNALAVVAEARRFAGVADRYVVDAPLDS